ncbi:leucine-rich repeat-containing protein 74a-like [Plakobranchus ocellatus]|uniref:Leucine-rich repeat-containing protein 74a-like n=1 Tax=Plakobranchus ocellatus TaxID=259542 RepID=A0AAV4CSA0_9GAST|nr:leucine-rich repeat-containing protein 74a-like [Plakobranchus ocellatus]
MKTINFYMRTELPSRKPPTSTRSDAYVSSTNRGLPFCRRDFKSDVSQSRSVPGLGANQLKGKALGKTSGKYALRMSTPSPPPDDDELDVPGQEHSKPDVDEIKKRMYTRECTRLGVTPVGAFLRSPTSTALQIPNYSLGPAGARALSVPLMLDSTLTTLNLEGNGLGQEGVVSLREVLTDHCAITQLNLKRNKLGYKGALVVCQILQTNRLIQSINVSANQIDDKAGVFFANMLRANSQLKSLDLSDNNLAEVAGRQLGNALSQNETLEMLDLSWNHFNGSGAAKLLEGVRDNFGLKHLNLAYNCFGRGREGKAPDPLCDLLRSNSVLLFLDLSCNRLSNLDVLNVSIGLSHNDCLHTLKIGRNLVDVAAVNLLLSAVAMNEGSQVAHLDMSDLPISENDLVIVGELRSRDIKVIHGRVHQTETDFKSKPTPNRPESSNSQDEISPLSAAEDNEEEAGATATYVSTADKNGLQV